MVQKRASACKSVQHQPERSLAFWTNSVLHAYSIKYKCMYLIFCEFSVLRASVRLWKFVSSLRFLASLRSAWQGIRFGLATIIFLTRQDEEWDFWLMSPPLLLAPLWPTLDFSPFEGVFFGCRELHIQNGKKWHRNLSCHPRSRTAWAKNLTLQAIKFGNTLKIFTTKNIFTFQK